MPTVLGLDTAWGEKNATGVALVSDEDGRWRCLAAQPSVRAFCAHAHGEASTPGASDGGGPIDAAELLRAAELIGGKRVDVIAADLPMTRGPVDGPRAADRAISRQFGRFGCSVHAPPRRPADAIEQSLEGRLARIGFGLATRSADPRPSRPLLETYPHAVLLRLMGVMYRVPYKVSRSRKYWPHASRVKRVRKLLTNFRAIRRALRTQIGDIRVSFPTPTEATTLRSLKPCEDTLDALLTAWCGVRYVERQVEAFGNAEAAIWVPESPTPDAAPRAAAAKIHWNDRTNKRPHSDERSAPLNFIE